MMSRNAMVEYITKMLNELSDEKIRNVYFLILHLLK